MTTISIVIPVFNEEENIPTLVTRLSKVLDEIKDDYEVVFVNDGSRDSTLELLRRANKQHPQFRYISFTRNFGHQTAVSAGLAHVRGDVVAVMDADLQDPPEVLDRFIAKWREGYDVVYAIRTNRKEGILKRACYWSFYRLLKQLSSIDIPLDSGDFCIMDRKVVDALNKLPERNRFVRGLRTWVGYKQVGVPYDRDARNAGEVKYTFSKLLRLALDGIISFSYRPLQIIGVFGFTIAACSFLAACVFLFLSAFDIPVLGHSPREVPGTTTLTLAIFFLSGVQLLSLGVIGEYIGRIFDEVKQRPSWLIEESSDQHNSSAALASSDKLNSAR